MSINSLISTRDGLTNKQQHALPNTNKCIAIFSVGRSRSQKKAARGKEPLYPYQREGDDLKRRDIPICKVKITLSGYADHFPTAGSALTSITIVLNAMKRFQSSSLSQCEEVQTKQTSIITSPCSAQQ